MNNTQKFAWSNLAGTILIFPIVSYLIVQIGIRHMTSSRTGFYITLCGSVLITGIIIFCLRKKQSPNEPDSDERDNQIKHKAIFVACFSAIPQLFVDLEGSVPVWSLPIAAVLLFYIILQVYSIAVLVQYRLGGKGE